MLQFSSLVSRAMALETISRIQGWNSNQKKLHGLQLTPISRHGAGLKSLMSRICFLFAFFLLPISLSAQIKIAEDKPQPDEPEWMKYKDIVYAPYDSSYMKVKIYPKLDAYEKYIGQKLYLEKRINTEYNLHYEIFFSDKLWTNTHNNVLIGYGTYGDRKYGSLDVPCYVWKPDDNNIPQYYTFIGVLSFNNEKFVKHHVRDERLYRNQALDQLTHPDYRRFEGYNSLNYDNNGNRFIFEIENNDKPYFVLQETQTGNTVYTVHIDEFILVGSFVKTQQEFIGMNILQVKQFPSKEIGSKKASPQDRMGLIDEKWKCTDVVLDRSEIKLVLQNTGDYTKEIRIDPRYISDDERFHKYNWINETKYNERWDKIFAEMYEKEKASKEEELKRKKEMEEYSAAIEKQQKEEEARRRQYLTNKYGAATAEKIMSGDLDIGMSKAACREIINYSGLLVTAVVEQTATTETWKVSAGKESMYLFFEGDKLTRKSDRRF